MANTNLSKGGAYALMFISSIALLLLLLNSPVAASCGGFATFTLIMLPYMMGSDYKKSAGFGPVVGIPVMVGFVASIPVFCLTCFFTWALLIGVIETGELQKQLTKATKK